MRSPTPEGVPKYCPQPNTPLTGRRQLLCLAVAGTLVAIAPRARAQPATAAAGKPERPIVTLDWTVAETLIAMGAPLAAAGELPAYDEWVRVPAMPDSVLDLGMRAQPNLEQLQRLKPALILNSDMFAGLSPALAPYGTVETIELYPADTGIWQGAMQATRAIGQHIGRPEAAQTLIDNVQRRLDTARARLAGSAYRQIAVVQFIDSRRVRVYGQRSVFAAGLERLGLSNAWPQDGNRWGFQEAGFDQLAQLDKDTVLVVLKPYPPGIFDLLARNRIWSSLPMVREQRVIVMEAVWAFGGLPSIARFGDLLVAALREQRHAPPPAGGSKSDRQRETP